MEHYEDIFSPIWVDFDGSWSERKAKTRNYVLNELPQWTEYSYLNLDECIFSPREFNGDENSLPFKIKLIKSNMKENQWELLFGDVDKSTKEEIYKWDRKDPYKEQKAAFLIKFLIELSYAVENKIIDKIIHYKYSDDTFRSDNSSYLYLIYSEMKNKEKFVFEEDDKKIEIYEKIN